jgi:hypothetical protein
MLKRKLPGLSEEETGEFRELGKVLIGNMTPEKWSRYNELNNKIVWVRVGNE